MTVSAPIGSRGIDEILDEARSRIRRYSPDEAYAAQRRGATLVDIRPIVQRSTWGEVRGSLVIERNVLEWRFDPRSEACLPGIASFDATVIVLCQEGYTSSLAAQALREIGITDVGDVDGGFVAWLAAGLPTVAGPRLA